MKKSYMFLIASAIMALAASGYMAIGIGSDGSYAVDFPCRVVSAEVMLATNTSASATLSVVKSVSREWDDLTILTNVSYNSETIVRNYTATNVERHLLLNDGFRYLAVNTPIAVSSNTESNGQHVVTVATNNVAIYIATNTIPYTWSVMTNVWFYPAKTRSVVIHTNRVPVVTKTHHVESLSVTNQLCTVSCGASGYGATNVVNGAFLKNGDRIIGSGTAFGKSPVVTVFVE